jgi:hypothetical protein
MDIDIKEIHEWLGELYIANKMQAKRIKELEKALEELKAKLESLEKHNPLTKN